MENNNTNHQSRTDYDAQQDQQLRGLLSAQDDVWRIFRVMAEFVDGFTMMVEAKKSRFCIWFCSIETGFALLSTCSAGG